MLRKPNISLSTLPLPHFLPFLLVLRFQFHVREEGHHSEGWPDKDKDSSEFTGRGLSNRHRRVDISDSNDPLEWRSILFRISIRKSIFRQCKRFQLSATLWILQSLRFSVHMKCMKVYRWQTIECMQEWGMEFVFCNKMITRVLCNKIITRGLYVVLYINPWFKVRRFTIHDPRCMDHDTWSKIQDPRSPPPAGRFW